MEFKIADLFEGGIKREYQKSQVLIYEGDPVHSLHYIESGYVKVYNILNSGSERIIFIYGPGDVFPLTSYLSGSNIMRYFYVCMSPVTIRAIPSEDLEQRIKHDLNVGETLVGYTTSVNYQFIQRIEILAVNDARRKVVALLAFLVKKTGMGTPLCELGVNLTQQDLADMSGLTRESTSRQLVRLRKEGVLLGTNSKSIINETKLEKLLKKLDIVI